MNHVADPKDSAGDAAAFCSHVLAIQQCPDALSYSFHGNRFVTCANICATAVHGRQQMDCDSAPKQDVMFRLINDDTKIFNTVDNMQTFSLHKELYIGRTDTTAPTTGPPGVAKSSNLLPSFVTQH